MDNLILGQSNLGKAVFANKDFVKGEEIIEFKGKLLIKKQLNTKYYINHFLQIDKNLYLGPSGELDDFLNHSCNPNSGVKFRKQQVILAAIKNIKKMDEIVFDYSTTMYEDYWELNCRCGNKNCRKKISDFKYLSKEIQQKYIKLEIVPEYNIKNLMRNLEHYAI